MAAENGAGCQPRVINRWLHEEQGWWKHADKDTDLLPVMWSSQKGFLTQATDSLLSPTQPSLTRHWTLSSWEKLLQHPPSPGKISLLVEKDQDRRWFKLIAVQEMLKALIQGTGQSPLLRSPSPRKGEWEQHEGLCFCLPWAGVDENCSDLVNLDLPICPNFFYN